MGLHLTLEIIVKDASAFHGLVHGHTRDIPPPKDKIVRVDHWEYVAKGNVNFLGSSGLRADANGGSTENGTNVVGLLKTILGVPEELVLVRKDSSAERRAVVTTHPNHHKPTKARK